MPKTNNLIISYATVPPRKTNSEAIKKLALKTVQSAQSKYGKDPYVEHLEKRLQEINGYGA